MLKNKECNFKNLYKNVIFLVKDVQEEGKYAIDSPGYAANPDMPPEEYALDENEERSMIEPKSLEDSKLQELIFVLIEWINDELADQRIIVKDIVEDLYDGQVLQKLLGMNIYTHYNYNVHKSSRNICNRIKAVTCSIAKIIF